LWLFDPLNPHVLLAPPFKKMFHDEHYGETTRRLHMQDFEKGFLLGLLVAEGHFGGDGKQGHINVRMHVRHEPLLKWVRDRIPGSRLYGPYHHGGRSYFQLMTRGDALHHFLIPLLKSMSWEAVDPYTYARFMTMLERYAPYAVSGGPQHNVSNEIEQLNPDVPSEGENISLTR
jgi:hypothetical protein